MNCEAARLLIGADPDVLTTELEAHLSTCEACATFQTEMRQLERDVRRALEGSPAIPVALSASASPQYGRRRPPGSAPTRSPQRQWALAATFLAGIGAALLLWSLRPAPSLAADVIAHVDGEPASWAGTPGLNPAAVERVMRAAGVVLSNASEVVYARTCRFRGHEVPHLVVQVDHRAYTVLVLRFERVQSPQRFEEGGYTGVLLPAAGGTLAILGLGAADVDRVAAQVNRDVRWLP